MIELMIGTVVFLGIGMGAFQIYTTNSRTAQNSQQQAKYSRELKTFMERFRHEMENTIQLPNAESSLLQVSRPNRCYTGSAATKEPAPNLAWGIIPYPGYSKTAMTTSTTPFEPSAITVNDGDKGSDAITLIYSPEESKINYLRLCDTALQIACPTAGAATNISVLGTSLNLQVGDFAVVADANRRELIRVTGMTVVSGNTEVEHSATKSIWNRTFTNNIGGNVSFLGQPVIYKVNIATYAHDVAAKQIVKDDHTLDDDFSPSAKTFGQPGLKLRWQTVAPDITKFQLAYVKMDDTETRTPQVGMPSRVYDKCVTPGHADNCGCENELGNPVLKTVKTVINFQKPQNGPTGQSYVDQTTTDVMNPYLLKKGLPYLAADHTGCQTNVQLFTKLADGVTPNPICQNKYCICVDRRPTWSLCADPDNDGVYDPSGCPTLPPPTYDDTPVFTGGAG